MRVGRPPLFARLLLARVVPEAHREFVTGDLNEAFERMAVRNGVRAARRWYWREALIAVCTRWPRSAGVREQPARGDSPVHALLQDLRFGCRLLWRSRGFAVVAILTLGLGMGANTTIFSWINSVLLTPVPGASDTGRMAGGLLSIFGGLAIVLAAVGLYGVLAFIVSRRTREIGIRMALGATRSSVFRLVVSHGLRLTLIGGALGIAAAFGIAKALSSILFGVEAHDPATLAAAAGVLLLSATAACLIPALRAMRVDPVRALKHE